MTERPTEVSIGLDGFTATARVERTDHGPLLTLAGENCDLSGQAPGEYLMVSLGEVGAPREQEEVAR